MFYSWYTDHSCLGNISMSYIFTLPNISGISHQKPWFFFSQWVLPFHIMGVVAFHIPFGSFRYSNMTNRSPPKNNSLTEKKSLEWRIFQQAMFDSRRVRLPSRCDRSVYNTWALRINQRCGNCYRTRVEIPATWSSQDLASRKHTIENGHLYGDFP